MARRFHKYGKRQADGFRSGFEGQVADDLNKSGVYWEYEQHKYNLVIPRSYTPDFVLDNGIIIETKGIFDSDDRRKHLEVRKQHPELDIRFVFSNAKAKLYKGAKSRYFDWCDKNDFMWAHRVIPEAWLKEKGKPIKSDRIPLKHKRKT